MRFLPILVCLALLAVPAAAATPAPKKQPLTKAQLELMKDAAADGRGLIGLSFDLGPHAGESFARAIDALARGIDPTTVDAGKASLLGALGGLARSAEPLAPLAGELGADGARLAADAKAGKVAAVGADRKDVRSDLERIGQLFGDLKGSFDQLPTGADSTLDAGVVELRTNLGQKIETVNRALIDNVR